MKEPKNRPRGRPSTFQRKEVLFRAMCCYWSEGPQNISFNELCRRLQVSKPTLYREFGGEDGLLEAVLTHYEHEVLLPLVSLVQQSPTLEKGIQEVITFVTTPNEYPLGCLFVKLRQQSKPLGPKTDVSIKQIHQRMQEGYQQLVHASQQKGELRSDIDVFLAAAYLDTQLMTVAEKMSRGEDAQLVRAQGFLALSALFPK